MIITCQIYTINSCENSFFFPLRIRQIIFIFQKMQRIEKHLRNVYRMRLFLARLDIRLGSLIRLRND